MERKAYPAADRFQAPPPQPPDYEHRFTVVQYFRYGRDMNLVQTEAPDRPRAEPFLKWAGGKRLLLPKLLPLMPEPDVGSKYIEPFLGGGALFFALQPTRSVLSDANAELVETYQAVQEEVEEVIRFLAQLNHDEDSYYRVRGSKPRTRASRAARFIYLNKTCFNGLYRVNTSGEFNVPFGKHGPALVVCDINQLRRASEALQGATVVADDFGAILRRARPGDLVYLDPPYTIAHSNNGFIEYNAKVFSWQDQGRLANLALGLVRRKVKVAISNAEHHSIRELYNHSEFTIHRISRNSTMAGSSEARFSAVELLIIGSGGVSSSMKGRS